MAKKKSVPASIRNANPGAMYPGKSAKKFGSRSYEVLRSKDGEHLIATFPSPVQGAAAQFDLLGSKAYVGMTVRDAITKWCGGYYVSTYLTVLQQETGVHAETKLTRDMVMDPRIAIPLCKAMALQEAGQPFPMSDAEWATAHALAFPGIERVPDVPEKPAAFEPTNEMPSPKPETRVKQAAKESRTIRGLIVAGFGAVVGFFEQGVQVVLDAATQLTAWAPAREVFAGLGASAAKVAFGLTIAGLAYAGYRRLIDAKNGRS